MGGDFSTLGFLGKKGYSVSKNNNLHRAKVNKNDEFYTQYSDIQKELNHYEKHFEGKTVLCNCDDPFESNFCKFFLRNFNYLKLKRLICTSYNSSPVAGTQMTFEDLMNKEPQQGHGYVLDISKIPMANGRGVSDADIDMILRTKKIVHELQGTGDFRSEECIEYLKQADIVCTNPPFSLFREYVAVLMEYKKKFLIIGNMNAITYKEVFPLIRDNKMWYGASIHSGDRKFYVPDSYPLEASGCGIEEDGRKFIRVKGVRWYTNLDHKKRHEELDLYKHYSSEEFPKYDNYDAINIDKVAEIPMDYDGAMGVPITFLDKYNPEQFEIVAFRKGDDGKDLVFTREREREFNRTFVSLSREDRVAAANDRGWEKEVFQDIDSKKIEPIDLFHPMSMAIGGCMNSPKDTMVKGEKKYARLLIRRKRKEII